MTKATTPDTPSTSLLRLRPYQRECLDQIREQYKNGKRRRILISLPTGTGKTVIFAQFPSFFQMQRRLLVLAHRDELIEQAVKKFRAVNPGMAVGIEQGPQKASTKARVVVASVQTLGRAGGGRLGTLRPDDFNLIVIDEAHHAVAATYRRILDHFGVFDPGTQKLVVGFTATPRRGDGRGLGEVFEDIAYAKGLEEMIEARFLCRIRGWRIKTKINLDSVRVSGGDFVDANLSEAVDNAARNRLLVQAYEKLARGRRCIVFCADIQHAKDVADAFEAAGVKAAAVWGEMPKTERRAVLSKFKHGRLDVITNCNVLTEGYDEPRVDCILMARPTKSLLLYAQMVGRGTRIDPDNKSKDLIVIDVVDNTSKHKLAGLHMLFDMPENLNLGGRDVLTTKEQLRAVTRRNPWVDVRRIEKAKDLEFVAERIDLFRFDPPDEIAEFTQFTWLESLGGGYKLTLPQGGHLRVEPNLLDRWEVRRWLPGSDEEILDSAPDLRAAVTSADSLVATLAPESIKLLRRDEAWRDLRATPPQLDELRRRDLPAPETLTRGQASLLITYARARVDELNASARNKRGADRPVDDRSLI